MEQAKNMQNIGFDNDGNLIVRNRQYRRKKIKIEVQPNNLPNKTRVKKSKKNYLKKRKK